MKNLIVVPGWVFIVLAFIAGCEINIAYRVHSEASETKAALVALRGVASTCDAELNTCIGLQRRVALELEGIESAVRELVGAP